jgi:hypothetical protein
MKQLPCSGIDNNKGERAKNEKTNYISAYYLVIFYDHCIITWFNNPFILPI